MSSNAAGEGSFFLGLFRLVAGLVVIALMSGIIARACYLVFIWGWNLL